MNIVKRMNSFFGLSVASGKIPWITVMEKFGEAPLINTADGVVDVWDCKTAYTFSTTADISKISSSDASDAVEICLKGLDENYKIVTQTITLDGQNKVSLTVPLMRFYRGYNTSGTALAGDVYIYVDDTIVAGVPQTPTKIRGKIRIGYEQTLMAIYTIPEGYTGYFK